MDPASLSNDQLMGFMQHYGLDQTMQAPVDFGQAQVQYPDASKFKGKGGGGGSSHSSSSSTQAQNAQALGQAQNMKQFNLENTPTKDGRMSPQGQEAAQAGVNPGGVGNSSLSNPFPGNGQEQNYRQPGTGPSRQDNLGIGVVGSPFQNGLTAGNGLANPIQQVGSLANPNNPYQQIQNQNQQQANNQQAQMNAKYGVQGSQGATLTPPNTPGLTPMAQQQANNDYLQQQAQFWAQATQYSDRYSNNSDNSSGGGSGGDSGGGGDGGGSGGGGGGGGG